MLSNYVVIAFVFIFQLIVFLVFFNTLFNIKNFLRDISFSTGEIMEEIRKMNRPNIDAELKNFKEDYIDDYINKFEKK